MKTILKIATLGPALVLMLLGDVPREVPLRLQLVPEAQAILGVWRRAARRTVIIGGAAVATAATVAATSAAAQQSAAAKQQAAAAQQQAAAAQQQAAAAQKEAAANQQPQQAAAAPPPAPPPAAAGKPLPLGKVVSALPAGCTSTPVGGIDYFYCAGNFYRAVIQGNNLVYVTAQP